MDENHPAYDFLAPGAESSAHMYFPGTEADLPTLKRWFARALVASNAAEVVAG